MGILARCLMLLGLLGLLVPVATGLGAAPLEIDAPPTTFTIGAAFDGSVLTLSGRTGPTTDVLIRFLGMPQDLHLKRKGKVLGLLWMNKDSITFKNAPMVYIVCLARPLSDMTQATAQDAPSSAVFSLGLEGLQERLELEPDTEQKGTLVHELLKMKEEEGSYREIVGAVEYGPASSSDKSFTAHVPLPSCLRAGHYQLEAYAIENGVIVARKVHPIEVKLTGMPRFMYTLAFRHSALYGVLSTLVAIAGGLLMALIFGKSKGAH